MRGGMGKMRRLAGVIAYYVLTLLPRYWRWIQNSHRHLLWASVCRIAVPYIVSNRSKTNPEFAKLVEDADMMLNGFTFRGEAEEEVYQRFKKRLIKDLFVKTPMQVHRGRLVDLSSEE